MSHHHQHTPEQHEAPDAWHTHTADEHPQQPHTESLDGWQVFVMGTIGYLLTVATIAVVTIYFISYKNNDQISFEEYPERSMGEAFAVQKPALDKRSHVLGEVFANTTPVWTDPEAGKVSIPVSAAMERVVERYKSGR